MIQMNLERDSQASRMNLLLPREGVAGKDGRRRVSGCLLFNISCSKRCAVVAHCGLHLHFSSGSLSLSALRLAVLISTSAYIF